MPWSNSVLLRADGGLDQETLSSDKELGRNLWIDRNEYPALALDIHGHLGATTGGDDPNPR